MNQDANPETLTNQPPEPISNKVRPYRLTIRQYLQTVNLGLLTNARVELLGGVMYHQMTRSPRHNYPTIALPPALRALVPDPWLILTALPLRVSRRTRPEPDLIVVPGPVNRYQGHDPHAREAALVVEVAEWDYMTDRGLKWRKYAAAGVPIYWIINLTTSQVEVYRDPTGLGARATYQQAETYTIDATVPVIINGTEVGRIAVREFMPMERS